MGWPGGGHVPLHGHGRRQTINKRPNVCNEIYAAASAIELYMGFGLRISDLGFCFSATPDAVAEKEKASPGYTVLMPSCGLSKTECQVEGFSGALFLHLALRYSARYAPQGAASDRLGTRTPINVCQVAATQRLDAANVHNYGF